MDNLKAGQKVKVGNQIGTIEKVSTWLIVNGPPSEETPCYFVRVPEWDMNSNGGRWIGPSSIHLIS